MLSMLHLQNVGPVQTTELYLDLCHTSTIDFLSKRAPLKMFEMVYATEQNITKYIT